MDFMELNKFFKSKKFAILLKESHPTSNLLNFSDFETFKVKVTTRTQKKFNEQIVVKENNNFESIFD